MSLEDKVDKFEFNVLVSFNPYFVGSESGSFIDLFILVN